MSQVVTAFDRWIYKNHSGEHIHFYLKYYSVGFFKHVKLYLNI